MPYAGTLGSCLLANELEGMGKEMLEMRIAGESWASIAQKFDLPNPSAARSKFTKLTGITDYKAKGQVLQNLANDLSSKASKTGIFEAKVAQKKVKKALDIDEDLNDLEDWQKINLKQAENMYGKDSPQYKQNLEFFKKQNMNNPTPKPIVQAVTKDLPEAKPAKWKSTAQLVEDTGLTQAKIQQIRIMLDDGHGYLKIKNALDVDFKQIDGVVWNTLLEKTDGKVWAAYKQKVTSQSGFDAVEKKVWDLKKSGLSAEDIAKLPDAPPKEIIDAILDGKWKLPPAGATKPIIPPPPPKPPAVYGTKVETGYVHPSKAQMNKWISTEDDANLTYAQRGAISNYTGSGSTAINNYLRNGAIDASTYGSDYARRAPGLVKELDATMRPTPKPMKVTRHTGTEAFPVQDLEDLVGDVYRDKGFLSTSIDPNGVFTSKPVKLIIDVPPGAQARWVQNISVHKSEQEVLLARNTPLKINSVERHGPAGGYYGGTRWTIHAEVVV